MERWREEARAEVSSIKDHWATKYGWEPSVDEPPGAEFIDLFVHLTPERVTSDEGSDAKYLLRLRYMDDFVTAGRREQFVDPSDRLREGPEFWPPGRGFNPKRHPPAICLEGTYGFHSDLHRERDGKLANINRLLLEIQRCIA